MYVTNNLGYFGGLERTWGGYSAFGLSKPRLCEANDGAQLECAYVGSYNVNLTYILAAKRGSPTNPSGAPWTPEHRATMLLHHARLNKGYVNQARAAMAQYEAAVAQKSAPPPAPAPVAAPTPAPVAAPISEPAPMPVQTPTPTPELSTPTTTSTMPTTLTMQQIINKRNAGYPLTPQESLLLQQHQIQQQFLAPVGGPVAGPVIVRGPANISRPMPGTPAKILAPGRRSKPFAKIGLKTKAAIAAGLAALLFT